MKLPVTKRGMVQTAMGSIFYLLNDGRDTTIGHDHHHNNNNAVKTPILCFHMSPRSSDEYLEVLPLLASSSSDNNDNVNNGGGGRVVIAFDIPGYGSSENPLRSCTIDEISDAFLTVADSLILGIDTEDEQHTRESRSSSSTSSSSTFSNYITVGSLLGNYFCVSLASRYPERIQAGILTNPWYNPTATTGANEILATATTGATTDATPIHDSYELKDDGSHLVELHSKRSSWLNDNELNFRLVHSEIAYLTNRRKRYAKGIKIEGGNEYDFETPVRRIVELRNRNSSSCCSFLCIQGDACATLFDQYGLDGTKRFEEACRLITSSSNDNVSSDSDSDSASIVRVETLTGEKSTVNIINQMPEEFAALCNDFLSERGL